jgi:hypothetical protein
MAKTKQHPEFEIEVDGEPYLWRLHGQPQWSRDPASRHGKSIAVRHQDGQREAIVEFPLGTAPKYGMPLLKGQDFDPKIVARAIASAIAAGWEPLSRGKTVAIMVDVDGG